MTGKNFKIRIVLTFATMLILAMLLQSIVVIFLGLRASIREDVTWARQTLLNEAVSATLNAESRDSDIMFSCMYLETADESITKGFPCKFTDKSHILSQQARKLKKPVVDFAGQGWNTFWFRSEVAIIAVPLFNKAGGELIGSITAERSLLPIYSRYEQDIRIALYYLLVNVLIFSSLCFFRISHLFFKPLDNLVQKAEAYSPDEQTLFLFRDNESPFRKLSTNLNTLFERIERDNRTLRQNVRELEGVNKELKEKNDLVVRSEKLATAGRLSAGLAHEIGNPLSIIQGYIELLSREDLAAGEKRQFSERAQQELDRIKLLIKQLLDFSGPRRFETEASVNALICDVISFVSIEKNFAKSSIRTKLLAEDDVIVADKDGLKQVLINCLFNAADATASLNDSAKEIVIATSHEQSYTMESLLVISVQDNGMGIAEDQLQYLFDPFFTTKDVGRGTGLGLFVCHTIIERLGGGITLCNRLPIGVEVRITLPIKRAGHAKQMNFP